MGEKIPEKIKSNLILKIQLIKREFYTEKWGFKA